MEWWLEAIPFRQDVPQFPSSTLLPTLSPSLFLPSSFLFVFSFFPFPTFFHWINMHCCMLSKSSKCSYFHSYPIGIFLWILKNRESHKQTSRHPIDPGKKCLETKLPVLSTHVNLEQASCSHPLALPSQRRADAISLKVKLQNGLSWKHRNKKEEWQPGSKKKQNIKDKEL